MKEKEKNADEIFRIIMDNDPYLGKLPYAVIRDYISTALDVRDRLELSLTRREYKHLTREIQYFDIVKDDSSERVLSRLRFYDKSWEQLRFIVFVDSIAANMTSVFFRLRKLTELKCLIFRPVIPSFSDTHFVYFDLDLVQTLEYLDITTQTIPDVILQRFAWSLKFLIFKNKVSEALSACHNLEYFKTTSPVEVKDYVYLVNANFAPKLKYLSICLSLETENVSPSPEARQSIKNNLRPVLAAFPNLRCLDIQGHYSIIHAVLDLLGERILLPRLTALSISGYLPDLSSIIEWPEELLLPLLLSRNQLEYLNISKYLWPDDILWTLFRYAKNLKFFTMVGANGCSLVKGVVYSDFKLSPIFVGGETIVRPNLVYRYSTRERTKILDITDTIYP